MTHSTTQSPLVYRINEVHQVAPWGRSTTYKLVKEGRLPARRLGASTFVLAEDLQRFLYALEVVQEPLE